MEIKFGNFNCFQNIPKQRATNPCIGLKQLPCDTVSFSGNGKETSSLEQLFKELGGYDKLEKLEPKHQGTVYKKVRDEKGNVIEKIPVKVDIQKNYCAGSFKFVHDGEIIGTVELSYATNDDCEKTNAGTRKNYPGQGVTGDRIIVDYINNLKEEEYGGVGHLADLLEVAACKELGIEPNVVSLSLEESVPLHYVRGKRFMPFESYHKERFERYGDKQPDDIAKEIVENTKKGEKFDTSSIKDTFITYMPKEMIKELEEELKEHPIF